MENFSALFWADHEWHHYALSWDKSGSGVKDPQGKVKVVIDGVPTEGCCINLNEKEPAKLIFGGKELGVTIDELYIFDQALPQRAIWDISRRKEMDQAKFLEAVRKRVKAEESLPYAVREAGWAEGVRPGIVIEGEDFADYKGKPAGKAEIVRERGGLKGPANMASGRGIVRFKGCGKTTWKVNIPEDDKYALGLRYALERRYAGRDSTENYRIWWSTNYATCRVRLDDKVFAQEEESQLYPTGAYDPSQGDVEVYQLHFLAKGKQVNLSKGEHIITIEGLPDHACLDCIVLTPAKVAMPEYARQIDHYQIPPAMYVQGIKVEKGKNKDKYIYDLEFVSRVQEPGTYDIEVAGDKWLDKQQVYANRESIHLPGLKSQHISLTFEVPRGLQGNCERATLYLWQRETPTRMAYRVWNNLPETEPKHPVLCEAPPAEERAAFREWLKDRDPKDKKKWEEYCKKWRQNSPALIMENLNKLDYWMSMSEKAVDDLVADGPMRYESGPPPNGCGWEYEMTYEPGDIDAVEVFYSGSEKAKKEWRQTRILEDYRFTEQARIIGTIGLRSTVANRGRGGLGTFSAFNLLSQAYVLTGDRKYSEQFARFARILARKFIYRPRHSCRVHWMDSEWYGLDALEAGGLLCHEDIGPGSHCGIHYLSESLVFLFENAMVCMDRVYEGLSAQDRFWLDHNLLRFLMASQLDSGNDHVGKDGKYLDADAVKFFPFHYFHRYSGDLLALKELSYLEDLYLRGLYEDGMTIWGLSAYGSTSGAYEPMIEDLFDEGINLYQKERRWKLRGLTVSSFTFANGMMPCIGEGRSFRGANVWGAIHLVALNNSWGNRWEFDKVPPRKDVSNKSVLLREYGSDPVFRKRIEFHSELEQITVSKVPLAEQLKALDELYLSGKHDLNTAQPSYLAPIRGLAMLRNHKAKSWRDWVEVVFDYGIPNSIINAGLEGNIPTAHAAKLHFVLFGNGQILSHDHGYGGKATTWLDRKENRYPATKEWVKGTISHNTVSVDEQDQAMLRGYLNHFEDAEAIQMIDASSSHLYEGVDMRRIMLITDGYVADFFLCQSGKEHTYDYMYHNYGELGMGIDMKEKEGPLSSTGTRRMTRNVRIAQTADTWKATWYNAGKTGTNEDGTANVSWLPEEHYLRMWVVGEPKTEVYAFDGPLNYIKDEHLDFVQVRRKGNNVLFCAIYEPYRKANGPKLVQVEKIPVQVAGKPPEPDECIAIKVTRTGGQVDYLAINFAGKGKIEAVPIQTQRSASVVSVSDGNEIFRWEAKK